MKSGIKIDFDRTNDTEKGYAKDGESYSVPKWR